ncbi:acylphosphatase-1-like [Xenia sp. Carnegie-2017]|uniref:acylphosphatase-1-like n=1 Tax=Xenia sp. Carnegie-2017 TaxID=2897299 RepID=UPI001F043616|nr:acylphosphatase-1-like [Xenia sp. Carnegie-2017]
MAASCTKKLISLDFEVFGKVQGVFFRKHTQKKGKEYGVVGYVKNTQHSTVVGQLQGEKQSVDLMKVWLSTEGSPKSKITKCQFSKERFIEKVEHTTFSIAH